VGLRNGFFFRAESFFNIAGYLDTVGDVDLSGGRQLHKQSHGESFLALFRHRLSDRRNALYLLDEPEAALSPSRQLEFLKMMRAWEESGSVQAILVTHAPLLMAYPGATLLDFSGGQLREIAFEDTEHFRLMHSFFADRRGYIDGVLNAD
jgi:predicted ATPase